MKEHARHRLQQRIADHVSAGMTVRDAIDRTVDESDDLIPLAAEEVIDLARGLNLMTDMSLEAASAKLACTDLGHGGEPSYGQLSDEDRTAIVRRFLILCAEKWGRPTDS